MAEETQDAQASVEEVQKFIREQVNTFAQEAFEQHRQQMQREQQQHVTPSQEEQYKQQLQQTINPFIEPGLQQARFVSADAKDYTQFYVNHPENMDRHDEIERVFQAEAAAGRSVARQTIADYLDGNERRTNPDAWKKRTDAQHEREMQRAALAADNGAGAVGRERPTLGLPDIDTFSKLSSAEQEKLLEGMAL